ncbi:MAG: RecX family transcriptional regulator [Eubacteriales bacterium]
MFILKITPCKKKGRVNIYSDEGYKCSLNMEFILKYHISEGKDILDDIIDEAIIEDARRYAFDLAIKYISNMPHTKKQVVDYLNKKGIDKKGIKSAIDKLIEYKYIDDNDYATSFLEELIKKGVSKRAAFNKMLEKGIDKQTANEAIKSFSDATERENASKAYEAVKNRYGDVTDRKVRDKIWRFLLSKGFDSSTISKILSLDEDEY